MGTTSTALGAMGFANTPYSASGSVIPSVQGSPAAPGAVVTPNLTSYTGTGTGLDTNGLPTYSADNSFKASLARIDSIAKRGYVTGGNLPASNTSVLKILLKILPLRFLQHLLKRWLLERRTN